VDGFLVLEIKASQAFYNLFLNQRKAKMLGGMNQILGVVHAILTDKHNNSLTDLNAAESNDDNNNFLKWSYRF
jgi:hypothetical protein